MKKYIIKDAWGQRKEFSTMKELNTFLKQDGMNSGYLSRKDFGRFNNNNEMTIETKGV